MNAGEIAQFADGQSIAVAPHNISSPVGTLAAAQFCAAIPNFLALEFHASHVPFWDDLVDGLDRPLIQNGFIRLPEKSGLGVKLNENVARKYGITESDVGNHLRLVRQRLRNTLKEIVAGYLGSGEDVEDEVRFILSR